MNAPTQHSTARLLIVDDELVVREALSAWFAAEGFEVRTCSNARETLERISKGEFDLAFLDIKMPGIDGMDLMDRLREIDPELIIVIMTGYASVETAIRALKNGAYDYVLKPVDPDELLHLTRRALDHRHVRREVVQLRENLREVFPKSELIGNSPPMKHVFELVEMVAPTDSTVLITGESGTGKEVVARAVHAASPRRNMPLVAIHCGALTETLLESELFGHERGAFTGAQQRKKGKFEVAEGGTVFLDEISDISLRMQTDLLRVLQEREIVRVGSSQTIPVDFRCIAATNRNLKSLVEDGLFRPDLYYRLNVVSIDLPPLRNRREDIPLLLDHFLQKFAAAMNRPVPEVSAEALDLLLRYEWPGNVREIENAVERAMVIGRGPRVEASDFPFQLHPTAPGAGRSLDDVERAHIERVLEETGWNLSRAARILEIDRTTLYNKINRYALSRPEPSVR